MLGVRVLSVNFAAAQVVQFPDDSAPVLHILDRQRSKAYASVLFARRPYEPTCFRISASKYAEPICSRLMLFGFKLYKHRPEM
jgi:hypothetical protein